MPPGPYSTALFAQDTKALVDELGLRDFHLVGVSMGGMIAQEYAIANGADLRSLTLACTYAEPGSFCSRMFAFWAELLPGSAAAQQARRQEVAMKAEASTKVVIDRFEGDLAVVVLYDDDRVKFNLPLQYLPEGVREGDHLQMSFAKDLSGRESERMRIDELLKDLKKE